MAEGALFAELDTLTREAEDDDDALNTIVETADKILAILPEDKDALTCKVVAKIRAQAYAEAIELIDAHSVLSSSVFERTYCCYRLARWDEAQQGVKKLLASNSGNSGVLHLAAQVAYRVGDGDAALKILQQVENSFTPASDDDALAQRANLLAACAFSTSIAKTLASINPAMLEETHEVAFNAASCLIELGQADKAKQILEKALDTAQETLQEKGMDEAEIEEELLPIKVQLAFIAQLQGEIQQATETYQNLLKDKPSDATLVAVAGNNLAVARGDTDLFDSVKRLKAATTDTVAQKLPPRYIATMRVNHALLLLLMGKLEGCAEMLGEYQQKDPHNDTWARLAAAMHLKQGNLQACTETLKKFAKDHPNNQSNTMLSLAQIHLTQKDYTGAAAVLDGLDKQVIFSPTLCLARVQLAVLCQDTQRAAAVLDETISHWTTKGNDNAMIASLLSASADFKIGAGMHKSAAADLERLLKLKPRDLPITARLVLVYSKCDPASVERLEKQLPVVGLDHHCDAQELESLPAPRRIRYDKLARPTDGNEVQAKKKKNKKRKRLPKHFDPNQEPDPYRWMPLKDRPYYNIRRKAQKKPVKGGAQGKVSQQDIDKLDQRAIAEKEKELAKLMAATAPTTPAPAPAQKPDTQMQDVNEHAMRTQAKKAASQSKASKVAARKRSKR